MANRRKRSISTLPHSFFELCKDFGAKGFKVHLGRKTVTAFENQSTAVPSALSICWKCAHAGGCGNCPWANDGLPRSDWDPSKVKTTCVDRMTGTKGMFVSECPGYTLYKERPLGRNTVKMILGNFFSRHPLAPYPAPEMVSIFGRMDNRILKEWVDLYNDITLKIDPTLHELELRVPAQSPREN